MRSLAWISPHPSPPFHSRQYWVNWPSRASNYRVSPKQHSPTIWRSVLVLYPPLDKPSRLKDSSGWSAASPARRLQASSPFPTNSKALPSSSGRIDMAFEAIERESGRRTEFQAPEQVLEAGQDYRARI